MRRRPSAIRKFLLFHYWMPDWTDRVMGDFLDLSPGQVKKLRHRLELLKRKPVRTSEVEYFRANKGLSSYKDIAMDLGRSKRSVRHIAQVERKMSAQAA